MHLMAPAVSCSLHTSFNSCCVHRHTCAQASVSHRHLCASARACGIPLNVGTPVGQRAGLGVGERVGETVAGPACTAAGSQRAQPTHADVRAACVRACTALCRGCMRTCAAPIMRACVSTCPYINVDDYGVCRLYSSGQDSARNKNNISNKIICAPWTTLTEYPLTHASPFQTCQPVAWSGQAAAVPAL
jgi:hypothetical protein